MQHFWNGFAGGTPVSTRLPQPALVLLRRAFDAKTNSVLKKANPTVI